VKCRPPAGWAGRIGSVLPAACAGLLLAACLPDHPVYQPARVYDPNAAIRLANLAGIDSVVLRLVNGRDTSDAIELWAGRPGSDTALPVRSAGDDGGYYFLLLGFTRARGQCLEDRIEDGKVSVVRNNCRSKGGMLLLSTRELTFDESFSSQYFTFAPHDSEEAYVHFATDRAWLRAPADMQVAGNKVSNTAEVVIDWMEAPLGPQEGHVIVTAFADTDTVIVRIRGSLARETPLGGDTLQMGYFMGGYTRIAAVPPGRNPDAFYTPDAWLTVSIGIGSPRWSTRVSLDILQAPEAMAAGGRYVGHVYARDGNNAIVDSLTIIAQKAEVGTLLVWARGASDSASMEGVRVVLDDTLEGISGADGLVQLKGLAPGTHLVTVIGKGCFGSVTQVEVDEASQVPAFEATINPPVRFAAIENPWGADKAAFAEVIGTQALLAGRSGQLAALPLETPAAKPRMIPTPGWTGGAPVSACGDERDLYLVYAESRRIGHVANWKTGQSVESDVLKFHPSSIACNGATLAAAGRMPDGRLAFGLYRSEDLKETHMVTFDEAIPEAGFPSQGPRIATFSSMGQFAEFALAFGTGPGGHAALWGMSSQAEVVSRLDLMGGVLVGLQLVESGIGAISRDGDKVHLQIFDGDMTPANILPMETKMDGLARSSSMDFRFMSFARETLAYFDSYAGKSAGRIALPGGSLILEAAFSPFLSSLILVTGDGFVRADF
jgi:hypothetical protein